MLTKRLSKIVSLLPPSSTLADVGCDHGYVGISALIEGVTQRVTFIDVSQPSLDKARHNCPDAFKYAVSFVCQDGLDEIAADCAVIAGMGGLEIISILNNAKTLPKYLLLQPMRNQVDVRSYLLSNYEIVTDEKFFDGKFYDVILACKSTNPTMLTPLQLQFGKSNLERPSSDFHNYLQQEQTKLTNIIHGCNDEEVQARLDLVNTAIAAIQED